MTEDRDRAEMQQLLAYRNYSKIAEAIGVKRAAVANWAAGKHITPKRLEQVRALLGQTQIDTAPSMTRRLLAGIMALEERGGVTDAEVAKAQQKAEAFERLAQEQDARLARRIARSQRTPGATSKGPAGGQSGASQGSKRGRPK